ncbi:hypothetical protein M9H77_26283 [Catharanthus roseus]|uniref:Uncharacterized protein n=1 Tax=Catharanthus roseus TaxID=4058 RepID=A0ACC0A9C1_CATRO|nr:hypothetical protein M9H77_26283 [Catharanthus roseus]
MLGRFTLDLDPVDRGRSTVRGLGPRQFTLDLDPVDRGRSTVGGSGGAHRLGPLPRGTQIPYPATVDLAEGFGSKPAYVPLPLKLTLPEHSTTQICLYEIGVKLPEPLIPPFRTLVSKLAPPDSRKS